MSSTNSPVAVALYRAHGVRQRALTVRAHEQHADRRRVEGEVADRDAALEDLALLLDNADRHHLLVLAAPKHLIIEANDPYVILRERGLGEWLHSLFAGRSGSVHTTKQKSSERGRGDQ